MTRFCHKNFDLINCKKVNHRRIVTFMLRETFKTEDEIGTEALALHFFFATEIGHKNVQIWLKLAETLA